MPQVPTIRKVPQLNIEHAVGDSFPFSFTVENSPNVPTDLTGRTYQMVIVVPGGTNIEIDGDIGTPTDGIVSFEATDDKMAAIVSGTQYDYTIKYTMATDVEVTSLKGKIIGV